MKTSPLRDGYLFQKKHWRLIFKMVDAIGAVLLGPFVIQRQVPDPRNVRKTLLAKIDHLGDVTLLLWVLPIFKRCFPQAELHMLVGSWAVPLLERHPDVAKLLVYDHLLLNREKNVCKRVWAWCSSFVGAVLEIRREQYDIGFDLRAYFPNSLLVLFLGQVRYRIGNGSAGFGFLLHQRVPWRGGVHETSHFLDLLRPIFGDLTEFATPPLPSNMDYLADEAGAKKLCERKCVRPGRYVILHPGAGSPLKTLSPQQWGSIAKSMARSGQVVLLTGAASERKLIDVIASGIEIDLVNLAGDTSIPVLGGLIKGAELVIGTDSFVSHLAGLLRTPTITVSNGVADMEQWRPLGPVRVVTNSVACSPCYRRDGCPSMSCLDVTSTQITQGVRAVLEGRVR